jgi:hypothetical protein
MATDIACTTEKLFTTLTSHPLLLCRQCQIALRVNHIVTHLHSFHKTPIRTAELIHEYTLSLWPQLRSSVDLSSITHPANGPPPPLEGLPLYQDGIQCRRDPICRYICRTTKGIKEH